jgi:predicted ATP-binding protein involved in virulence
MEKTLTIKTTEITWRQKMDMTYTVVVITDGKHEWAENYDNALDAVSAYNKFIDHGLCKEERVISLVEPSGKFHSKIFLNPEQLAVH